jgi:hypothetical protein
MRTGFTNDITAKAFQTYRRHLKPGLRTVPLGCSARAPRSGVPPDGESLALITERVGPFRIARGQRTRHHW